MTDSEMRKLQRAAETGDASALARLNAAQARVAPTLPDGWTVKPAPGPEDHPIGSWSWDRFARSITVALNVTDCSDGPWIRARMEDAAPSGGRDVPADIVPESIFGKEHPILRNIEDPEMRNAILLALDASPSGRVILEYRPDPTEDPVWQKFHREALVPSPSWERRFARDGSYAEVYGPDIDWGMRYTHSGVSRKGSDEMLRESISGLMAAIDAMPDTGIRLYHADPRSSLPDLPDVLMIRVDGASDGGHGADLLYQVNHAAFIDMHEDAIECGCVINDNGSIYVLMGATCEHRERLCETLCSLESYPVLDDDAMSRAEVEDQEESWRNYLRRDVVNHIAERIGAEDMDIPMRPFTTPAGETLQEDPLFSWMREHDIYIEGYGDNTHLDFRRPIDRMDVDTLRAEMAEIGAVIEMPEDDA